MKETIVTFKRRVLSYHRVHGRHDLPWRHVRDPYLILVSEIMLQQTQVDRVIPFFLRWTKKFPTAQRLADAPLSDVLREWQGLGYNRRGKLLRECAKEIVGRHGGKVPKDRAALIALPGIGPYTAGAIRAFAFDEPGIFIETNIRAALIHHFFPRAKNVPDSRLVPILGNLLKQITSSRAWYSALMDYGSHIKKTNPNPSRRSAHHTTQSVFEGSLRQMRGEIVQRLMRNTSLASLRRIGPQRFAKACHALIHDGLIKKHGRGVRLAR